MGDETQVEQEVGANTGPCRTRYRYGNSNTTKKSSFSPLQVWGDSIQQG